MGFKKTIRYTKYHKISPYAYTSDDIHMKPQSAKFEIRINYLLKL